MSLMDTNKDIAERTGMAISTIRERARKLGIPKRYRESEHNRVNERIYTPEEVVLITDGRKFKKTGRPPGTSLYPGADDE